MLVAVGYALGLAPARQSTAAVLLLLSWERPRSRRSGLLMAGTLRAEATLAAANGVYLIFLLLGGIVFPLSRLPGALQGFAKVLPGAALATGLRRVLEAGPPCPGATWVCSPSGPPLAGILAARYFRWE